MIAQIKPWGNSQGIRLSKELLETAGFQTDDILDIRVRNGQIILCKKFRHRTLEERAADFENRVGPYCEFEWDIPAGREIW